MTPDIFFINKCSSLHQNNANSDHLGGFNERHIIKFFDHQAYSKAVARKCYVKKVFSKISWNWQEKTCVGVFIFAGLRPATLFKKRYGCFPVNFSKFLKTYFFIELFRWLLLPILKPLDSQRQLCKWIYTNSYTNKQLYK